MSSLRNLGQKQEVILNAVCLLAAAIFFLLALSNLRWAGNFLTIDSLFMTVVCLALAAVFMINPALWARERGLFAVEDAPAGSGAAAEDLHFEGTTKLFLAVLGALLGLTLVEVLLAYFHVPLALMLTILLGLSIIKAVLIVAYFMHLRFERMSLVLTLVPMLVVCICLLLTMFPDGFRSKQLRPYGDRPAVTPGEQEH
ncbi:MAG TPA: cytochrome C oxidase subunit IV family protein [Pyrinomonadaceae bacterium]|jgi:cytochrome c oxidase subunit 4